MAVEDFGGKVLGRPIEIVSADHQTKPDVGAAIARKWYDVDGVKMITGLGTSSVALAVRKISQEKGMIDIVTGAASADLTGPACSETGAHWVYDTYALAKVTGSAIVKGGGDSWFFLTADYAFGHALERDVTAIVTASGGKVLGGDQASAEHAGLLLVPAAGPGVQGQDHRPRQCRPGHDQLDQAGRRVRHRQGRPAPRRPPRLLDRRRGAHPAGRAGPGADRGVLLGPERRDARLDQALPRQARQDPEHADRRRPTARPCTTSRPCRPPAPTTPRR